MNIRDEIDKKKDRIIDHYSDNVYKYKWQGLEAWIKKLDKLESELASLKAELEKEKLIAENTNPMSQMDSSPYEIKYNGITYVRK